jgi:hypothetical protein
MTNQRDEIILTRLSALLKNLARLELSQEEHRALQVAMRRAQSASLTTEEQFVDASEFFSLEIVEALQDCTTQIIEAIRWLARPGADKEERLQKLSRLVNTLLGLDFMSFCYLLHVAQVASWASGESAHGGASNA